MTDDTDTQRIAAMSIRSFLQTLWFAVLSLVFGLAGCGDLMRVVLEGDAPLPVKNEPGVRKVGQQLGDALSKGDHTAAYALCSAQLKSRQTEEQFTAEVKNQWQLQSEGARPVKVEVEPWMPAAEEFDEWDGMPKNIKYAQLLGVAQIKFVLEIENEEIVRSFHADAVVVDEEGEPKVGYLEFYEAD
jgi:hypothetical protein